VAIAPTPRLFFRSWTPEDLPLARRLWGDPEVMRFIDVRGGLSDDLVREKLQLELDRGDFQYWPAFEIATGDFVGCCGLKPWTHSPEGGHELGFHLVKSKWGLGFAPEAARGIVDHAFRDLRLSHLMAGHHPANLGAKHILTGLGFRFVEMVHFKPTGLMHPSYRLDRERDFNSSNTPSR
jgi:[ribosomal protein S5]-alanine N-acetyltransferase